RQGLTLILNYLRAGRERERLEALDRGGALLGADLPLAAQAEDGGDDVQVADVDLHVPAVRPVLGDDGLGHGPQQAVRPVAAAWAGEQILAAVGCDEPGPAGDDEVPGIVAVVGGAVALGVDLGEEDAVGRAPGAQVHASRGR